LRPDAKAFFPAGCFVVCPGQRLLRPQRRRANLLKRKAQARQRKAAESEGSD